MSRCYQTVHDGVDHIAMRCEKRTSEPPRSLIPTLSDGAPEMPGLSDVRLSGDGEDKTIYHPVHSGGISAVMIDGRRSREQT